MITYCTNIHPGESWDAIFRNVRDNVPFIKEAVAAGEPFPIGLRLSGPASREIDDRASGQFMEWLAEHDCFVPTLNGFPYGTFHGQPVKKAVYIPDWLDPERAEYTNRLASLLDRWLPNGHEGSISTLPLAFGNYLDRDQLRVTREQLLLCLVHLDRLRQVSGKRIVLCLEPEPGCFLATVAEAVDFIDRLGLPGHLRDALGICCDCCHEAVGFEDAVASLFDAATANIPVGKIQISSALRLTDPDRSLLAPFCDPCYLHQVIIRNPEGSFRHYTDLPDALGMHQGRKGDEWRVHFHLPIFWEGNNGLGTTNRSIVELLPLLDDRMLLEIETYTWQVLPPELRTVTIADSIIREILWLKGVQGEAHRRP